MYYDDRLATVLRQSMAGERSARTQYRQLLDLLGRRKPVRGRQLAAEAWRRMAELAEVIPASQRARIVSEGGARFASPELVAHLANDDAPIAAAALARANLSSEDWQALIPRLPVRARGFLRLRRDLPPDVEKLLERLGIHDRGLPMPVGAHENVPVSSPPQTASDPNIDEDSDEDIEEDILDGGQTTPSEIGRLVERIEAFQRARQPSVVGTDTVERLDAADPRLPLGDRPDDTATPLPDAVDFTTDAGLTVDWASEPAAEALVGLQLSDEDRQLGRIMRAALPIAGQVMELGGAAALPGAWRVDAAPQFHTITGAFDGYAGRLRRVDVATPDRLCAPAAGEAAGSEQVRQMLHELRTPVNAIQGFAELIQQQMFGPVPHDYRAYAAAIAGDAARMLAGFDELDRLARLEGGAIEPEDGSSDFAAIVRGLVERIEPLLSTRMAGFEAKVPAEPCAVAMPEGLAEGLAWRMLATLAGAASPGEELELALECTPGAMRLAVHLPAALMAQDDIFRSTAPAGRLKGKGASLGAGAFGSGFTLRLVRAEARNAGGSLVLEDDTLVLALPRPASLDRGTGAT